MPAGLCRRSRAGLAGDQVRRKPPTACSARDASASSPPRSDWSDRRPQSNRRAGCRARASMIRPRRWPQRRRPGMGVEKGPAVSSQPRAACSRHREAGIVGASVPSSAARPASAPAPRCRLGGRSSRTIAALAASAVAAMLPTGRALPISTRRCAAACPLHSEPSRRRAARLCWRPIATALDRGGRRPTPNWRRAAFHAAPLSGKSRSRCTLRPPGIRIWLHRR